ncbi:MAG: gamma-glutamyl-gamma-aminobutyrate hydrolase family protein [Bacilli bacterium]|jgi:gamma-glutamyl-gamma-aminobutyrate hydrolase PuuD|nr:gamma-glutamyl-gamma-aminobutyrate hydrolase family protein [Bacilli bacterium]
MNVIIGIVSKHNPKNSGCEKTYITDATKQAIFDNDAIPIGILPPKLEINYKGNTNTWEDDLNEKERSNLIAQINLCDGIILQGGLEMDNYEFIIAKYCYENNIPILGICAGQNAIVKALGGTSFQINNPEKHNVSRDYVHNIKINKNSKFYSIIESEDLMVNSLHSNSIDNCPKLNKVAFCEDGYPDVIESKDKDFYIGVRFHPEDLYHKNSKINNIFKVFINTCKKQQK